MEGFLIPPPALDSALQTVLLTDAVTSRLAFTFSDVRVHRAAGSKVQVSSSADTHGVSVRLTDAEGVALLSIATVGLRPLPEVGLDAVPTDLAMLRVAGCHSRPRLSRPVTLFRCYRTYGPQPAPARTLAKRSHCRCRARRQPTQGPYTRRSSGRRTAPGVPERRPVGHRPTDRLHPRGGCGGRERAGRSGRCRSLRIPPVGPAREPRTHRPSGPRSG